MNLLRITTNVFESENLIRSYPRPPIPREMTRPQYLLILVSVFTLCCHGFISVNIPPRYLIVGVSENLVLPRDNYKTSEIMSALLAAHPTVLIRCKRPVFPNLKKFGPRKKSFLDKILRGPLCNVRAYKVQAPPIETQAGITWRPMGVLQPIHFILSAIGRQCSSVLSRFKTVQIQTLRKRKIGITLLSSP